MPNSVDELLKRLKNAPPGYDLKRLEAAVWTRIERHERGYLSGAKALGVQLCVSCGALALGLAIAQFYGMAEMRMPLNSELIVLSDDSTMAPSVRLGGGV